MKTKFISAFIFLCLPVFLHAAKIEAQPVLTLYGPNQSIGDVDFRSVRLAEIARLVSKLSGYNVVASSKVADIEVTLYLRNTTLPSLVSNLSRAAGLWFRFDRDSRTYILMSEEEFRHDIIVARDDKTRVLTLKHNNVVSAANAVQALFGSRVQLEIPVEEAPPIALIPKNIGLVSAARTNDGRLSGTLRNSNDIRYNNANSGGDYEYNERNGRGGADSQRTIKQLVAEAGVNKLRELQTQEASSKVNPTGAPIYVTYNNLHNLLMVRTADEDALTAIDQLVASIDLPSKQVLLEMQILELGAGDDFQSSLSVAFSDGKSAFSMGTRGDGVSSSPSNFSYAFLNEQWKVKLNLLQSQNKVKVISTPSLLSINNQPARLFIGEEAILTTGISSDAVSNNSQTNTKTVVQTEKRDIGQTLTILPRINADRSVALTIDQEVSNVIKGGASLPITLDNRVVEWPIDTVSNATSQLTVLAQNGRSIIIGGLTRSSTSRRADKVPLLGDIPVLGHLFRDTKNTTTEKQMVLIITPRVMDVDGLNSGDADFENKLATKTSEVMRQSSVQNQPDLNNIIAPFREPVLTLPAPVTVTVPTQTQSQVQTIVVKVPAEKKYPPVVAPLPKVQAEPVVTRPIFTTIDNE